MEKVGGDPLFGAKVSQDAYLKVGFELGISVALGPHLQQ
jgi:hypothetical protein